MSVVSLGRCVYIDLPLFVSAPLCICCKLKGGGVEVEGLGEGDERMELA